MNINNYGILYIVATPIGNLQDISLRALETLKTVNYIAAEDTRHSAGLLANFSIATPVFSLHEHNEKDRSAKLLNLLAEGKSIALISDAGTPLISDPGFFLVKEARKKGIQVVPIPGSCAAIAALSASGLPTDRFIFEGFLPAKSNARLERLTFLENETRTMIFYEAPHRILDALEDMQKIFGNEREAVLARELTKKFETIHSAVLSQLVEWVKKDANQQRGEIVLLIAGSSEKMSPSEMQEVLTILLEELPVKQAAELTAKITGGRKNELYDLALRIKNH